MQCPKCKRDSPLITALVNGECGFCFAKKYPPKMGEVTTHMEVNGVWVPVNEINPPSIFNMAPSKGYGTGLPKEIHKFFHYMQYGVGEPYFKFPKLPIGQHPHLFESPIEAYAENMQRMRAKTFKSCKKCIYGVTLHEEPWGSGNRPLVQRLCTHLFRVPKKVRIVK